MDVVLLVVRLLVGVTFIRYGTNKLFSWFDRGGPSRALTYFEQLGFRRTGHLCRLTGTAEAVAGVLLVAGFLTPLAATMVAMIMINAYLSVRPKRDRGVFREAVAHPLPLAVVVLAMAYSGPGALSADALLGLELHGPGWAGGATIAALLSSFVAFGTGRLPRSGVHPDSSQMGGHGSPA